MFFVAFMKKDTCRLDSVKYLNFRLGFQTKAQPWPLINMENSFYLIFSNHLPKLSKELQKLEKFRFSVIFHYSVKNISLVVELLSFINIEF